MLLAATKTRPVFWHFVAWLKVLWYVLAVASVVVFVYGVWRPIAQYRRGHGAAVAAVPGASCPAALARARGCCSRTATIERRDHAAGLGARARSSTASWCCSRGP